jgi:uncharacterized protein (TIGR03066 family)
MKSLRLMLFVLLAVAVGLYATSSTQEVFAQGKDDVSAKLVGTWELAKSGGDLPPGTIIEFTKDGKLKATLKADDQTITIEGTYKLDKNKIEVKVKVGEEIVEETVTIKRLTDKELEVEDKEGKVDTFKKK